MSFYITTPIYYVNDVPHLGTAYTTIVADALARFHRARGEDTYFLTGTDEHGQKIQDAAVAKGMEPKAFTDAIVERFRASWNHLGIANDDFIRTTDERHKVVVQDLWRRIEAAGDIYLGAYEGPYCVRCEAFYTEGQLVNGTLCPVHGVEVSYVKEPSYFFAMSKYQDQLLAHFEAHPEFVQPEAYRREILSFIRGGLRDLSISRTSFSWGIPAPGAPAHVIYVWLDALTNYVSALGGFDSEQYRRYWPAVHLIGKDILRFHAVYWPCFLLSAGLPLPRTIFAHGWWNVRGKKISKSLPATRVDPSALADVIGLDPLRYFLLREVPLGLDGDFTYESLIGRYNADLANDLGNLLHRALTMTGKFCAGKVPAAHSDISGGIHAELAAVARATATDAATHFAGFAPSKALESIWRLVAEANRYVDAAQPWKLAKDPAKAAELEHTMHTVLEALYWSALMVAPVMPGTAAAILERLGVPSPHAPDTRERWPDPDAFGRELPAGLQTERGEALFPRIDNDRQAAMLAQWLPPEDAAPLPAPQAAAAPAPRPPVDFETFTRLDLRVAQILVAEAVPKAKRLLRLELDVGGGEIRQVVAGIATAFQPEQLLGRKVIFLANLEPATIRGVRSEGMVLAAGGDEILGLSTVDADVPPGTPVR